MSASTGTRTLDRSRQTVSRIRTCTIEVIAGPSAGQVRRVEQPVFRVGSHAANDLVLPDEMVSRQHLELTVTPVGHRVVDLGSSNGTFIGSARVGELTIVDPVTLRLGGSELRVTPLAEGAEVPLSSRDRFGSLVGSSVAMRELFHQLEAIAPSDCAVLIEGETGAGKEELAESLHRESSRAGGPFVVVDCGALVGPLMESELFGHARGAFTGASEERVGLLRSASGGTVLLDEVGELPLPLQAKLLGVLERRRITPLGGSEPVPIDVRIVAATHRDLAREVNEGRFRADLFYRLAVVRVRVPPLRERLADLPLLAAELLAALRERRGADLPAELSALTLSRLAQRAWPGNVRELRNVVERAALQAARPSSSALEREADDGVLPYQTARDEFLREFERDFLIDVLRRNGLNVKRGALASGVEQRYFRRLLRRHDISLAALKRAI